MARLESSDNRSDRSLPWEIRAGTMASTLSGTVRTCFGPYGAGWLIGSLPHPRSRLKDLNRWPLLYLRHNT